MSLVIFIKINPCTCVNINNTEGKANVLSFDFIFSSPGQSPGRAIVLSPASALALAAASALAKSVMLKFLCDGQGAVRRAILSL